MVVRDYFYDDRQGANDRAAGDSGGHGSFTSATLGVGGPPGWLGGRAPDAPRDGIGRFAEIRGAVPRCQRGDRGSDGGLGSGILKVEVSMSVPRYHVDSNIRLRFLIGEPLGMFEAAAASIERAERGEVVLELSPWVLAKTAFTMRLEGNGIASRSASTTWIAGFFKECRPAAGDAFLGTCTPIFNTAAAYRFC